MKRVLLAAVMSVMCGVLSGSAQEDVTGSWAMEITNPLGLTNKVALVLEQDGETVTGMAGDTPLEGSVDGGDIVMAYDVPETQVGPMTLTFEGTVDGSSMEGAVTFGHFASGTWTAAKEE
ncbi:MAG: hypothetical protein J4F30_06610 [Acidobacteria bacterium]|nr:hypothetical protein [Acidobacteriota bacterium]